MHAEIAHSSVTRNAATANLDSGWKVIRRVKVYLRATDLVSFQHTQRWRINMDRDEVLTAELGISELMNVGHGGACHRARRTFAIGVVTKAFLAIESEDCFGHETLMNADRAVRTVVIVNRRLLARPPADHEHFDRFIATNSMTPVVTFFESDVGLELRVHDFDA